MHSRRELLAGTGALIGTATLAGCSGILGSDGENRSYAGWMPDADEEFVQFGAYSPADIVSADDTRDDVLQPLSEALSPVTLEDLDRVVGFYSGTVIQGSFGAGEIHEALVEGDENSTRHEDESYSGYDRYEDTDSGQHLGVRDGVAVAMDPEYFEQTIDAHDGDADRLVDEHDDVARIVDELGSADFVTATVRLDPEASSYQLGEGQAASGTRLDVGADETDGATLLLFETAEDVDESLVRERVEIAGARTLQETTVDGRLATATFTQPTEELRL